MNPELIVKFVTKSYLVSGVSNGSANVLSSIPVTLSESEIELYLIQQFPSSTVSEEQVAYVMQLAK